MKKKDIINMVYRFDQLPNGGVDIEFKNSPKLFHHVARFLRIKTASKEKVGEFLRDLILADSTR